MRRAASIVALSLLLAACQSAPDLLATLIGAPADAKLAGGLADIKPAGLSRDVKPADPPRAARAQCVKDFWGNCTPVAASRHAYRWRYVRPGTRTHEVAAHSYLCHPRRRVIGEERPSMDEAQKAADSAWMSEVRYDFGERYQDIGRARDVRNNCGPSSKSSILKTAHFRCAIEATPCRAPVGLAEERSAKR